MLSIFPLIACMLFLPNESAIGRKKIPCAEVVQLFCEKTRKVFGSKMGALLELERSCRFIGNSSFSTKYGARNTLTELVGLEYLEDSPQKDQLLRNFFTINWAARDGEQAKKGDVGAQEKIFEGLYHIARFYNSQNPNNPIDIHSLHTASGVRNLIAAIRGSKFQPLKDRDRNLFMGRNGAFGELEHVSKTLLDSATFESDFGLRDTVLKLAAFLDADEESALIQRLKKIKWGSKDGGSAKRGGKNGVGLISAQDRAFEGIYQIAEDYNQRFPDEAIALENLHEAETFIELYEKIVGARLSTLDLNQRLVFMGPNGAFIAFRDIGKKLGVRNFRNKYGALLVAEELMKSEVLIAGPEKDQLIKDLEQIPWGAMDGSNAMKTGGAYHGVRSHTGGEPQDKIYSAIVLIAKLYNLQNPNTPIDLNSLYRRATFNRLVAKLGF